MISVSEQIDNLVRRVEYQITMNNRAIAKATAGVKPIPTVDNLYEYHESVQ